MLLPCARGPCPLTPTSGTSRRRAVVVMSDYGDQRCGVGSSDAIVAEAAGAGPVLDPARTTTDELRRRLRAEAADAAGALLVFPTVTQVGRPDLLLKALVVRRALRGGWVRMHLHEFDRLDRRQRLAVAVVAATVVDRLVVSSAQEALALRRRYRGLAARRAELVVVPPANPSAPSDGPIQRSAPPALGRTLGVHGQYRPDKGIDWLLAVLRRIDHRYDRLVVVGRGWEAAPWPRSILGRFAISVVGQADRAELADWFARWDLALAPFDGPPTDGRLSLRTPLAHGVPTLTRGPRPVGLRLDPPHLLFDDEVDLTRLPDLDDATCREGQEQVAALEVAVRAELVDALFGP